MISKKIKSIDFGILSPETIRKMSTVRIVTPDTYSDDGYPIEGGLMDLRLGVIDPGLRCKTCGQTSGSCPGHFGAIEMVRPVLHIGYVKMILTLLNTTCSKCGRVLIEQSKAVQYKKMLMKEESDESEQITIDEIAKEGKKVKKCPHCGEKQKEIKLLKPTTFFENDQRLFPTQIRERVERITEPDLELLGINPATAKPEWTVLTVLPVPPATVRPSITLETGERSEDDLTHKLVDILRINQRLADNIAAGAPQLIIEDLWDLLQYHVTTYFNNEVSGIPPARHRSGRALKTLFQRIKGKEGRIRYNLSGKRVNFSARTVISPDPSLSISEVGVPQEIAEELTVPEHITEYNLEDLKRYVENKDYPRANYVIRPDGKRKKITELNKEEILKELTPGYIVERQLIDGDISLFNRQPSLHRLSMMCHTVKVLPGKTFRMNDAVTSPYNADFDGDEMNLHIPQTEEAKVEAEELMKVENNLLSVREGKALIGGEHDHVTGAYLLTKKGSVFDKETAVWLLGRIGINEVPEGDAKGMITGKDIFSMILPKDLNVEYKNRLCVKCGTCDREKCEFDAFVKIKDGKILTGAIEAKGMRGPLLEDIIRYNGNIIARDYIDQSTKLALAAVMQKGYTISLSDYELSENARRKIGMNLSNAEKKVDEIIEEFRKGKLERVPGKTVSETLEDKILTILDDAREESGIVSEADLGPTKSPVIMTKTGARGSIINLIQMNTCVGQTAVRGKRINRGYRTKALPYFKEGDMSAKARGFIKNSFIAGLTPSEFFFHAMSGRDTLIDKGINTSKSGYMQRRIMNAMLDISMKGDDTVRDASGNIIQFRYGEDGVNPTVGKINVDKIIEKNTRKE